ncbi:MAG: type II secretion system protein GspG [Caldiserica bacterium]|nr:type II secretion system protein GspG [Caldisericota bacterium]
MAIPNYLGFRDRANISAARESLGSLRTALEVYRADHNNYPAASDAGTLETTLTASNPIPYFSQSDWDKLEANISSWESVSVSADDYTIKVKAKDRANTTVTATPGGIAP